MFFFLARGGHKNGKAMSKKMRGYSSDIYDKYYIFALQIGIGREKGGHKNDLGLIR